MLEASLDSQVEEVSWVLALPRYRERAWQLQASLVEWLKPLAPLQVLKVASAAWGVKAEELVLSHGGRLLPSVGPLKEAAALADSFTLFALRRPARKPKAPLPSQAEVEQVSEALTLTAYLRRG